MRDMAEYSGTGVSRGVDHKAAIFFCRVTIPLESKQESQQKRRQQSSAE
jgi:hypothetical protein